MLAALRTARPAFRSLYSPNRGLARLTLVGYIGADPELKTTKNDREYVSYVVGTKGNSPPPGPDGTRAEPTTTWHRIYAFNPSSAQYVSNLKKGTLVFVETEFEMRESQSDGDESGHRRNQVFLKHESIKVLKRPVERTEE